MLEGLVAVAVLAAVPAALTLIARRARRSGVAGQALAAAMAAYDEAMHVTALEAYVEVRREADRGAAAAAPADGEDERPELSHQVSGLRP
jgi:hypothetical protein